MASEKREIEIALKSKGAESGADRLNTKVKGVGKSADGAESSMLKLTKVAAALGTALATSKIISYADAWTNVNNRLKSATTNTVEFTKAQQGVISIAQQAGVDLAGVADGYSRIAQNTAELGISQDRVLDVTRKVTLAIKAGGATAQEASSVIVQLGQGLGAGALQGDELRSIMEASIPITKALANEFNVTTGELKKLGSEGKITADRVVSAIENMDEKSLTFTKDISSGFTEVSNSLTVFVGNLDESFAASENIAGVLSGLANNIDLVAESLAVFIKIGAAIYLTNLTKAVIANTVAFGTNQLSILKANNILALNAGVSRTAAASTWALTYAMRALKAALPFGIILLGLEVLQNMLMATNDQIEANDRYAESTRKLNARLETRAEKERAIALRTAAEVDVRNQDKVAKQEAKIQEEKLKVEKSNLAELSKMRGDAYDESERLSLIQITKSQNRVRVMEEELNRLKAIANESAAAFTKIQKSIGGKGSKNDVLGGEFANPAQANTLLPDLDKFLDQEGIFSGSEDIKPSGGGGGGAGSSFIERLKLETEQMQAELEVRRQLNAGYITEQQANDAIELQNLLFNYEAKRQTILEQEFQTETLRQEALAALREQELEAIRLFEASKTEIKQEADDDRLAIEEAYSEQVKSLQMSTFSSAVDLMSQLIGESKASAVAGIAIQTASAFAANQASTAAAATLAYASQLIPGDPTSIARATAAAAKANALGQFNGGLIIAAGALKAGGALSSGGSASTGGGSVGASSVSAPVAATPSVDNQTQNRTINITGLDGFDDDQPIPLTVGGLKSLLSSNEDVNIAINQGQQNATRLGAI